MLARGDDDFWFLEATAPYKRLIESNSRKPDLALSWNGCALSVSVFGREEAISPVHGSTWVWRIELMNAREISTWSSRHARKLLSSICFREAGSWCWGGSTHYDFAFVTVWLRWKTGWVRLSFYFLGDLFFFRLVVFVHDIEVVLLLRSETHLLSENCIAGYDKDDNEEVEEKESQG